MTVLAALALWLLAGIAACALWARSGIGRDIDMPTPCAGTTVCAKTNPSNKETQ